MPLIRNKNSNNCCINLSRRRALKLIAFYGLMGFPLPKPIHAGIQNPNYAERSLSLYHPNTKETLNIIYWSNGDYISEALSDINYFMRDRRTDEVQQIDTRLLDLMWAIWKRFKSEDPFYILSGYRSNKTNTILQKSGKRASNTSYHKQGKAADIRLPGCRLSALRRTAMCFKSGGVGYYPKLRFIHVDVGPNRYWYG